MENRQKIPISTSWELAKFEYTKSCFGEMFQVLQSLRQREVFCDIKLRTDEGTIIFGHKVVLALASPYFHAMFKNFAEKNKELVVIEKLDSTALQLLVDFIYSGKILVTENNVQVLLPAANLLLLNDVKEACCEFLQKQLQPTNCLGIKAFADLHDCTKLLTSSELYIQQNFSEVVKGDEFLFLSSEEVVKFISSDQLAVRFEETVFECVICWIKHDLNSRKCNLPQLMEHVRLPLTSKNYIDSKVDTEPLFNNCPKCKEYIYEALHFHLLKRNQPDQLIAVPESIRTKPRLGYKVILVVGGSGSITRPYIRSRTEWYDPKTNRWSFGPIIRRRYGAGLAVLYNHFVFVMGGHCSGSFFRSVDVLDLFSEPPCWKPTASMLVKRTELGVGVINNNIYAVGGYDGTNHLNSAETFDCSIKKWSMIPSMSTTRPGFAVGVLNNLLYAVGGFDDSGEVLNSVECYDPSLNRWTPVAEMCVCRCGAGVGILDGVLYAVGGYDGAESLKSVEAYRPSTGVWTTVADMNFPRQNAGVVTLSGLLYAIGGNDAEIFYDSVEFYDPISDTWFMLEAPMNVQRARSGVVTIVKPPYFKTC